MKIYQVLLSLLHDISVMLKDLIALLSLKVNLIIMDNGNFDPNAPGISNGCYFGLPFQAEDSELVIISVPWDVTTSYGGGAAAAPDAIIDASLQVDLYDPLLPDGWRRGIATLEIDDLIAERSERFREDAQKVILHLESGGTLAEEYVQRKLKRINEGSAQLNNYVYDESRKWISKGKSVALVGGDHSTPLGLIRAIGEAYPGVGILHLDAHADLREAYEGFTYSHASIMYNTLKEASGISALVSVGIRDYCDSEAALIRSEQRVTLFDDYSLSQAKFKGENWDSICERIVVSLPREVYLSFDIDALTPENCPNTGTPVPGGLTFTESIYLINKVVESGRTIVGFDLNEVSPKMDNDWDANVGARILYKLCNLMLKSKG